MSVRVTRHAVRRFAQRILHTSDQARARRLLCWLANRARPTKRHAAGDAVVWTANHPDYGCLLVVQQCGQVAQAWVVVTVLAKRAQACRCVEPLAEQCAMVAAYESGRKGAVSTCRCACHLAEGHA